MERAGEPSHRVLCLASPSGRIDALRESLSRKGIEVLVVETPFDAIVAHERAHPDVILVERSLRGKGGLEAGREILRRAADATLVLFDASDDQDEISLAFEIGFRGYLAEDASLDALADALGEVLRGDERDPIFGGKDSLSTDAGPRVESLTDHERNVLRRVTDGADERTIAEELDTPVLEVRICLEGIFEKLGVADRASGAPRDDSGGPHLHPTPLDTDQLLTHLHLLHPRGISTHSLHDVQDLRGLHDHLHREDPPAPA